MFTGIITAIGTITKAEQRDDMRITIACPWDPAGIDIGASICCSGVCLTVVERGGTAGDAWFAVDVSSETISRTATSQWEEGRKLNLEPALKIGDELGGHLVTGHVDAVGEVALVEDVGGSTRLDIHAPAEIAPYIAEKGSVTVQGVSLTVNSVTDDDKLRNDGDNLNNTGTTFSLNIIPHTGEVTTLGALSQGDTVNLEIDVLARYLKRMQDLQRV